MATPTPSLAAETTALRDAFAGLNRNDIPAFVRILDPEVVRIEPPGFPGAGTHRGLEAVAAQLVLHRGNWAEGTCEPQRFIVAGDRIVVPLRVHVRLKNETAWRDGRIADVFTFRAGKVIEWRTFATEHDAFTWAGVAP